jgi:stage V sporulation protein AF
VGEPANDKVLRGPREGFIESLVVNTGLIRRRIRDTFLRIEKRTVGKRTKTDIALCYIQGKADPKLLKSIQESLLKLNVDGINMGLESVAEMLIGKRWYNPFPRIRYTERPDAACAMIMEGSVILLCDNYPSAMILPTTFFSFTQDTNDFYFTPFIGKYLKTVRLVVYAVSLLLTPLWYLLISTPEIIPQWLLFIIPEGEGNIPILLQLIGVEICIDGLKLASLNAPDTMSNSLGIIGGLLLGDFAVSVGWLCESVIFYMSFVAIANFTQPNFELGYAFKFMRMITLALTGVFHLWGFIAGIVLTCAAIVTTPTLKGAPSYLYPLIPFDKRALLKVMSRISLDKCQKNDQ